MPDQKLLEAAQLDYASRSMEWPEGHAVDHDEYIKGYCAAYQKGRADGVELACGAIPTWWHVNVRRVAEDAIRDACALEEVQEERDRFHAELTAAQARAERLIDTLKHVGCLTQEIEDKTVVVNEASCDAEARAEAAEERAARLAEALREAHEMGSFALPSRQTLLRWHNALVADPSNEV